MYIKEVRIKNFKCFDSFSIKLDKNLTILVGNNDEGKSTILEAIHLALTGYIHNKPISQELSQYLFNRDVLQDYLNKINAGTYVKPPELSIELMFDGTEEELAEYSGNFNPDKNITHVTRSGFCFILQLDQELEVDYQNFVKNSTVTSLPIEYYTFYWSTCAWAKSPNTRKAPIKSILVDSSSYEHSQTSSQYVSRIIKSKIDSDTILKVSQEHRELRSSFKGSDAIKEANLQLSKTSNLSKDVQLSVDIGTKNAWEDSVIPEVGDHPFHFLGKGTQSILKIEVALTKGGNNPEVILIEEPETNLSHGKLNSLLHSLNKKLSDKQVIIATHSSFVANKLGLSNLALLQNKAVGSFNSLKKDTQNYFKHLAGYDTLRYLLCKKAILVEGDSDELIVQKAYMQLHNNKLPIEDDIEVISVGTAFKRFLELGDLIKKETVVITDNDGKPKFLEKKYSEYLDPNKKEYIQICYSTKVNEPFDLGNGEYYNNNTLEPNMIISNTETKMAEILEFDSKEPKKLRVHMLNNKTAVALQIFLYDGHVEFPGYINNGVK